MKFNEKNVYKKSVFRLKIKKFRFFFQNTSKFQWFVNSDDCIGKITSLSIRPRPVFIEKRFKVDKKLEFQVIVSMKMLTRFSEGIFNPICYTGDNIY